jgi:hypothetical protein
VVSTWGQRDIGGFWGRGEAGRRGRGTVGDMRVWSSHRGTGGPAEKFGKVWGLDVLGATSLWEEWSR